MVAARKAIGLKFNTGGIVDVITSRVNSRSPNMWKYVSLSQKVKTFELYGLTGLPQVKHNLHKEITKAVK